MTALFLPPLRPGRQPRTRLIVNGRATGRLSESSDSAPYKSNICTTEADMRDRNFALLAGALCLVVALLLVKATMLLAGVLA